MGDHLISVTRQVTRTKGFWYTPWWYEGRRRLAGRVALVTGAGASIGQAICIAFAREGADVMVSFSPETTGGALETSAWVQCAGRTAVLSPYAANTELGRAELARLAYECFGRIDIIANTEDVLPGSPGDGEAIPCRAAGLLLDTCVPQMSVGGALTDTLFAKDTFDRRGDIYQAEVAISALALTYAARSVRVNGVCIGSRQQYRDMSGDEEGDLPAYLADIATAHVLFASEPALNGAVISRA